MSRDLKYVPLAEIKENPVALREVNRQGEGYIELVDSVKAEGILNPVVVRPAVDDETGEHYYSLVDGLHRYTAAKDAGLDEIPCHMMDMDDEKVLYNQIIANIQRIETRPVEYSHQLQRILSSDPTLTAATLASRLGKSQAWLNKRLGLLKLDEGVADLVDSGKINLSNAFALAKLPPEEQKDYSDRAMTLPPQEFTASVLERKRELDKARREGRKASDAEFTPVPKFQKMKAIREELENKSVGPQVINAADVSSVEDAFYLGLQWCIHMDPLSIEEAKQKDEERRQKQKEKREKARQDRLHKDAKKAELRATRLKLEADMREEGRSKEEIDEALEKFDVDNGLKKEKQEATT